MLEAARRLGIKRLYPEQEQIITSIMQGKDTLVILPTGFGKSACYQIPSMLLPKPTVVISPLIALIRDQQQKLIEKNIPCVRVDGTLRAQEFRDAIERIAQGGSLLVMTTPESLGGPGIKQALMASGASLVAVDEVHCLSEWGHDFRPSYMRIAHELKDLGRPPILGLTATATAAVRDSVVKSLALKEPTIIEQSPHRRNLAFSVVPERGYDKGRPLMKFIKRLRRPGVIYASTTKDVDAVYVVLRKLRVPAHRYHGKMNRDDREKEQTLYMKKGRKTVLVATSAFGLGIDMPDIRYIVHYAGPSSIEQYMQEAGRAGRDGRRADCIMLYDPDDRETHVALLNSSRVRADHVLRFSRTLIEWVKESKTPKIAELALSAQMGKKISDAVMSAFIQAGYIELDSEKEIRLLLPVDQLEEASMELARRFETLRVQDNRRLDTMAEYATTDQCRSVYLSSYFGDPNPRPCGQCDNCRRARTALRTATREKTRAPMERPTTS